LVLRETDPGAFMPTSAPESNPFQTSSDSPDANLLTRQPAVWLLVIIVLALGLRAAKLSNSLQRDEFGAVYAVAERQTASPEVPPTAENPLVPVAGLTEVSERSVLPFGVRNPLPLYHDLLYCTINVLPISEWSLRLPSLLASLGCVIGVYFLCRRLVGVEMAMVAALLVAVEPVQVTLGAVARPYALGNFACVLSFVALLGVLNAAQSVRAALAALGYGAAVAFMGYMNPVLLLVVVAHLGMLVYWAVSHKDRARQVAWGLCGLVVATLLLIPEFGYFKSLHDTSVAHRDVLIHFYPMELRGFLLHNSTFLVGLLVAGAAGLVARFQSQGEEEAATAEQAAKAATEPDPILEYAAAKGEEAAAAAIASASAKQAPSEPPPPDNPDVVWVGRLWLLLPQLAAIVLAYAASEAIFFSRFLSYTTLGGMLILAYLVTRLPAHQARLGSAAAVAVAIYAMSFTYWGRGHGVTYPSVAKEIVQQLNDSQNTNAGDMILLRSNVVEGDFLPDMATESERRQLAGAIAAPFTTLYVPAKPLSIVVLSRSLRSQHPMGDKTDSTNLATTFAGDLFNPEAFYTPELAARLRAHPGQFLVVTEDLSGHRAFLTSLLPWIAAGINSDLKVATRRPDKVYFLTVPAKTKPTDWIEGFSNAKPLDFPWWIRVQREPEAEVSAPKQ
jgi:hypothetical protein